MKTMKKIIPALAMLLVSAVLLGTSTFAWFSMNNRVTVTGMEVKTKVSNNLLISPDEVTTHYTVALNQSRAATIEPASTVDGISYWYTASSNVTASGDAKTDTYTAYNEATSISHPEAAKTNYDAAFNTNYGFSTPSAGLNTVSYGYIDYSFYLQGNNTEASTRKIFVDTCNILYNGAAVTDKAFRVAIFAKSTTAGTEVTDEVADGNRVTILAPASATYFTAGKAISENAAPTVDVKNLGTRAVIATVATGATVYYKVTVRLWLEGEDNTCNNDTFAALTGKWTLNLGITLGDSGSEDVNAVNQLGSAAVATLTGAGTTTATAALTATGETAATYAFYNAADDSVLQAASASATFTNSSTEKTVYCIITSNKGTTYRTPNASLTAS